MNKVGIISLARSGSTLLSSTLSTACNTCHEPLRTSQIDNPEHADIRHIIEEYDIRPDMPGTINVKDMSKNEIQNFFDRVLNHKDIVKHICTGTYIKSTKALIDCLIERNGKIILLYREDLFRAVMSLVISEQTNIWQLLGDGIENIENVREKFNNTLVSIDMPYFRKMMKSARENINAAYKHCMSNVDPSNLQIWRYEDLYAGDRSANFDKICEFIGVDRYNFPKYYVNDYFLTDKTKQSSSKSLQNITNYSELLEYKQQHPDLCTLSFE